MGARGPLTDPHSIRGQKADPPAFAQNPPDPPTWLTPKEKEIFHSFVEQAMEAGLPMEHCDQTVYANAARLQYSFQREKDRNVAARIMRTLQPLLAAMGHPLAMRRRLGVAKQQKKVSGPLAVISERKQLA